MKRGLLFSLFVLALSLSGGEGYGDNLSLPANCKVGQDCLIDVEQSSCGDGTKSYFQLTQRNDAKNVLIYLSGGGACWDKKTCEGGYAKTLTREEVYYDWQNGKGIHNAQSPKNPFRKDFNIVTVPYCTGDVHAGSRDANYGSQKSPYVVRHRGYQNVQKTIEMVKRLYPNPEKVVLLGCSAGGIGSYYHMRNLVAAYPSAKKYVVSDAGLPFKPPYVYANNYEAIMAKWGINETLPEPIEGEAVSDFGGVVKSNTIRFPDVRFAFISSYRDIVMTFFSLSVGAPSPETAVKKNIIDVADNDIGREAIDQKVFYTDSSRHCHSGEDLEKMVSLNEDLGSWLTAMVSDEKPTWENVRPDLHRVSIKPAKVVPSLEHLKGLGHF